MSMASTHEDLINEDEKDWEWEWEEEEDSVSFFTVQGPPYLLDRLPYPRHHRAQTLFKKYVLGLKIFT